MEGQVAYTANERQLKFQTGRFCLEDKRYRIDLAMKGTI